MHTDHGRHQELINWKNISDDIYAGQFTSATHAPGYNKSRIYVKKWEAKKPQVRVFLLHDLAEHHGRFRKLSEWLMQNDKNISLVMLDFVGHGLSSGTRGHIEKFSDHSSDLKFLLSQFAAEKEAGEKWILLGHGLGALVALDFFNAHQDFAEKNIDGYVLSNFIIKWPKIIETLEDNILSIHDDLKNLAGKIRPTRINPGEKVLSDPQEILRYEQDPLIVHRPTLNSYREMQRKMKNLHQDSYFLSRPVLLLQSEYSHIAPVIGLERFSKGIKKELVTEKKYSHVKHDLYNEREREKVFSDILEWLKKYEN